MDADIVALKEILSDIETDTRTIIQTESEDDVTEALSTLEDTCAQIRKIRKKAERLERLRLID